MENEMIQNDVEQQVDEQQDQSNIEENHEAENENNDSNSAVNDAQNNVEDPVKAAEKRAGKAIAAQRREYQERINQLAYENEQLKRHQSGGAPAKEEDANVIYDPKTGRTFDLHTPLGLQVWREQEAERVQNAQNQQKIYRDTAEKIMSGQARYDNFDDSLHAFKTLGSDDLADALVGSDDPAAVVDYLGSNIEELNRLSRLNPHEVKRAVYKLESALQGKSKKISNTPPPVKTVSEVRNVNKEVEDQSLSERVDYYRKKYQR